MSFDKTYVEYALEPMSSDEARFRDTVLARLPPEIVDCHAHMNGPGAAGELTSYGLSQRRSSFPEWDIELHASVLNLLYGDRHITTVWMPQPHRGIEHKRANTYILTRKRSTDYATLCGLPDDRDYTEAKIRSGDYVALKMYPHYVEPPYTRINEYFPDWALDAAQQAGIPIVLHTARRISECWPEVEGIADTYPNLWIILAHLGRDVEVTDLTRAAFTRLARHRKIVVDSSMVTDVALHRVALETLGGDRVLYGSDEPFNLLSYVEVVDPEFGRTVVSRYPYHWNKLWAQERYGARARQAPLVHFQSLQALQAAMDDVFGNPSREDFEQIFNQNARQVLGLAT